MTETELLDLLESEKINFSDLSRRWSSKFADAKMVWCYFICGPGWIEQPTLRDCIRKLAEQQENK